MPRSLSETNSISGNIADKRAGCYLAAEEPINAATHGVACALSVLGLAALLWTQPQAAWADRMASCVFAVALVVTFAASAISHAVQAPRAKFKLRAWDQGVIYLLIIGTQTPLIWKFVPASVSWPGLLVLWCAAVWGFVSKVVFHYRVEGQFSPASYIALGWLPALALCAFLPGDCVVWVAGGGVLYTIGVIFLRLDYRVRYFHALWHLFVIAASACHFVAIYRYVLTPNS